MTPWRRGMRFDTQRLSQTATHKFDTSHACNVSRRITGSTPCRPQAGTFDQQHDSRTLTSVRLKQLEHPRIVAVKDALPNGTVKKSDVARAVVVRTWRGWRRVEDDDRYAAYIRETGFERAVFYPEDDAFLVDRELAVCHWELVD